MTNSPRITALEGIIESLSENLEGADLYTVLSIIADSEGDFMPEFLNSILAQDIIRATQSNPTVSRNALIRISRADNAIARYGDE